MHKRILIILSLLLALCAALSSCGEEHTVHTYGEWTVVTEASCTAAGSRERVCECGEKETEEIPRLSHTYGEWEETLPIGIAGEGLRRRSCECGEVEEEAITSKTLDPEEGLSLLFEAFKAAASVTSFKMEYYDYDDLLMEELIYSSVDGNVIFMDDYHYTGEYTVYFMKDGEYYRYVSQEENYYSEAYEFYNRLSKEEFEEKTGAEELIKSHFELSFLESFISEEGEKSFEIKAEGSTVTLIFKFANSNVTAEYTVKDSIISGAKLSMDGEPDVIYCFEKCDAPSADIIPSLSGVERRCYGSHMMIDATCQRAAHCDKCDYTEGEPSDSHSVDMHTSECEVCGEFCINKDTAINFAVNRILSFANQYFTNVRVNSIYYVELDNCACRDCEDGSTAADGYNPYIAVVVYLSYVNGGRTYNAVDIVAVHEKGDDYSRQWYPTDNLSWYYIGDELTEVWDDNGSFHFYESDLIPADKNVYTGM